MTEAYGIRKARQSGRTRPGGSERREGAGAGGTGRASPAELTRLIGDPLSGPDRQMEKGSSFGGLRHFAEHIGPKLMPGNACCFLDGKHAIGRHDLPLRYRLRRDAERASDIGPAAGGVSGESQCFDCLFAVCHERGYKHNLNSFSRYS